MQKPFINNKNLLFPSLVILSLIFSLLPLFGDFSVQASGPECFLSWSEPTSDGIGVRRIGELSNVSIEFRGFSPNETVVLKNTNLNNGDTRSAPVTVDSYGNFSSASNNIRNCVSILFQNATLIFDKIF